jgi:hypothetical protein
MNETIATVTRSLPTGVVGTWAAVKPAVNPVSASADSPSSVLRAITWDSWDCSAWRRIVRISTCAASSGDSSGPGTSTCAPGLRIDLEGRFGGAAERLDLRVDLRDLPAQVGGPVLELLLGGQDRLDRLVAAVLDERGRERVGDGRAVAGSGSVAVMRRTGSSASAVRADLRAQRVRVVAPELLGSPFGDVERGRGGDLRLPDGARWG